PRIIIPRSLELLNACDRLHARINHVQEKRGVGGTIKKAGRLRLKDLTSRFDIARALKPLWAELPADKKRLYIQPDGVLASIPWGILPLDDRQMLEDRYDMVYIGSLSALSPPPRQKKPIPSMLTFGGIDYDTKPPPGPTFQPWEKPFDVVLQPVENWMTKPWAALSTEAEANAVCTSFSRAFGRASTLRDKNRATKRAFLELAPNFSVIHLATHAYVEPSGPAPRWSGLFDPATYFNIFVPETMPDRRGMDSGIVFAGANQPRFEPLSTPVLTAFELSSLDLTQCELAVLSACSTSEGARFFGDTIAGLNRSLQLAGVDNTITSLWDVNDRATTVLFKAFYKELFERRVPLRQAFRNARDVVRRKRLGVDVWAGFVLYSQGVDDQGLFD
ncbi:MAG: CHAT domain-containing protein, partial [Verrucomicrobiota bacterium]